MNKIAPYPGTRDFYPDEMEFRNRMFAQWSEVCESFGFRPYNAPVLESLDLYLKKSSEEIVSEQLYIFTDRGDRKVAIRPEMTPTLARMTAARDRSEPLPLRYYSIANFMRYERPGKGRLREFYQLNVDLIGQGGPAADAEIVSTAVALMNRFGARPGDYSIRYSDRRLLDSWLEMQDQPDLLREIGRLLDKKDKIGDEAFETEMKKVTSDSVLQKVKGFLELARYSSPAEVLEQEKILPEPVAVVLNELNEMTKMAAGAAEVLKFDPSIVRGFDYYTGFIFEINDNHPDNRRALFGGGRYDRLMGQFGKEDLPAVGFGMGDVTFQAFLELHGLIPERKNRPGVFITLFADDLQTECSVLADELRQSGIPAERSLEATKKFGKQFEIAQKKG